MPADDLGRIQLIENRENLGIAKALNQGLAHAIRIQRPWILTLDQDTECYPDMVQTLLQVAANCKPEASVVGGNYYDAKLRRHDVPNDAAGDCIERKTVITSGCLVDSAFARSIGGFREDYFIDQVDHEFCLRVRAHGRRVVITTKPVMDHSVGGNGGPKVPFLGLALPDHSPLRKYYITRNSIVTVRTYWKSEPTWCLVRISRLLLGVPSMILLERDRFTKILAFVTGFADAMRRRLGRCTRSQLTR
jgi:rhamnosyltransferase